MHHPTVRVNKVSGKSHILQKWDESECINPEFSSGCNFSLYRLFTGKLPLTEVYKEKNLDKYRYESL